MELVWRIVAIIVVLLIVLHLSFQIFGKPVYRFYSNRCPYCIRSKAEWKKFKKSMLYCFVVPVDVDVDDKSPYTAELMRKYNISSWPSIIIDSGNVGYVSVQNASSVTAEQICAAVDYTM